MNCIRAKTIYTGTSVRDNAYLVFGGEKVNSVSDTRKGTQLGEYPVITPAFIDPHSHIGIHRAGEPSAEAESNEHMDSILTLVDALDSIQMDDTSFRDAVEMGVLYSCVLPGSGNIIGGRSAVVRNYAADATTALLARAGTKAAFGYNPMSAQQYKGDRPSTRMGALAILRRKLDDVRVKMKKLQRATPSRKREILFSAEEEVLRGLLTGRERLRAHVHKTDDIAAALRLADEFGLQLTFEHAKDVHGPETFAELKRRNISVTYGPMDSFAYKVELKHENWRNIRFLLESGVHFGLMTDHPVALARQLFLHTRWFLRCGMNRQEVVELVTRRNAEILGVDKQLGTLARGRWASFVCWNGDPFDIASYPAAVYGEGRLVYGE